MTKAVDSSTPRVTPPPGYRLLEEGERIRKTDLYLKWGSATWKPSNHPGGRWNPRGYWPMARKIEKGANS